MPASNQRRRAVRVFMSSTFKDMHKERNHLAITVFPALREWCLKQGIFFNEVDLRWGVPSTMIPALDVCLHEVDECRPFFIGLVGHLFGSIAQAEDLAQSTRETYPWIIREGHAGRSYTEIEMQHGVLRAESTKFRARSLFYFRSSSFSLKIAQERGLKAEGEVEQQALERLKDSIRSSGLPLREDYADEATLGRWMLEDLQRQITAEFGLPAGDLSACDAWSLAHQRLFVGDMSSFQMLAKHALGKGPPLVLTGEQGMGKSALLAVWTQLLEGERECSMHVRRWWWDATPGVRRLAGEVSRRTSGVLCLSVEAAPELANWPALLGSLIREMSTRFQVPAYTGAAERGALMEAFSSVLHALPGDAKFILCIDGLHHLQDHDPGDPLSFLPPQIPPQVRLVLSMGGGEPTTSAARRRGWKLAPVARLKAAQARWLAEQHALQFGKRMEEADARYLESKLAMHTPLSVKLIVDLLRLSIEHFTQLKGALDELLANTDEPGLVRRYLATLQTRISTLGGAPHVVMRLIRLLAASRSGLADEELRELLAPAGQKLLPGAIWAPLRQNLGGYLWQRAAKWQLSPVMLAAAKQDSLEEEHEQIIFYFTTVRAGWRQSEELPWQCAHLQQWRGLLYCLTQPDILARMWRDRPSETRCYWELLKAHGVSSPGAAYAEFSNGKKPPGAAARAMAALLGAEGSYALAEPLLVAAIRFAQLHQQPRDVADAMLEQAAQLAARGHLRAAVEGITPLSNSAAQADALVRAAACANLALWHLQLAFVQRCRGDSSAAQHEAGKAEAFHQAHLESANAAAHLGMRCRAHISLAERRLRSAWQLADKKSREVEGKALAVEAAEIEREARLLGSAELEVMARHLKGQAWQLQSRYQLSIPVHQEEVKLAGNLGDKAGVIRASLALATGLMRRGKGDAATLLLLDCERDVKTLGNAFKQAQVEERIGDVWAFLGNTVQRDLCHRRAAAWVMKHSQT